MPSHEIGTITSKNTMYSPHFHGHLNFQGLPSSGICVAVLCNFCQSSVQRPERGDKTQYESKHIQYTKITILNTRCCLWVYVWTSVPAKSLALLLARVFFRAVDICNLRLAIVNQTSLLKQFL
jgi:hypothetical protein